MVKLLLETGKVNVNSKNIYISQTPLPYYCNYTLFYFLPAHHLTTQLPYILSDRIYLLTANFIIFYSGGTLKQRLRIY
jgi:hypothetical protein